MKARVGHFWGLLALLAFVHSGTAAAEAIVVQCTVDAYRSSFSSRPDSFIIQVDVEARIISTYYGDMPLKMTRRELRGTGSVSGGWQSNVTINRKSGRLAAGVDKVERGKHSYADLKGTCILPQELRGSP